MQAGDLVLVWFPFSHTEQQPFKKRPVLVLGRGGVLGTGDEAVLVAMVTSNARRVNNPGTFDVPIRAWAAAGLLAPSVCRATRIWTAETRDIARSIGRVEPQVIAEVKRQIMATFSLDS